jgi:hypothetical protein
MYQFFRVKKNWDIKAIAVIAFMFVLYNYLTVTAFDAIPRYNTPYLFFYLVVGFVGVILLRRSRRD